MIRHRAYELPLDALAGKIIFHANKGADLSTLISNQSLLIGSRLGRVTNVNGPNRIFYETAEGQEKYVSIGGIGFVCDTEDEAISLEKICDETRNKIRAFSAAANKEMEDRIRSIMGSSSRRAQ